MLSSFCLLRGVESLFLVDVVLPSLRFLFCVGFALVVDVVSSLLQILFGVVSAEVVFPTLRFLFAAVLVLEVDVVFP